MTSAADDDAVRERAVRTDLSVLLEAPAGSGKTSVLTERLLALLDIVDQPEQILAVTFTRKAAAEMRARVLQALTGRLDGDAPHRRRLQGLAARVHRRSEALGWHLAEHPARLRIQTLDALNVSIAAQAPLAAGTMAPVIADRPEDLYERAARRALIDASGVAGLREDADLLFARLDNRWSRLESMLASMLEKRAHWLPHMMDGQPPDLRGRIGLAVEELVENQLARNLAVLDPGVLTKVRLLPGCGDVSSDPASLACWQAFAGVALTAKGTLRKRVDRYVPDEFRLEPAKGRLQELLGELDGHPAAQESLVRTLALPPVRFSEADAATFDALARLLPFAVRVLYVEFASAGRVDHAYMAGAARAALTEEGEATDLALRFGARLHHVLIDEFQDTSLAQFELLQGLVRDWSPGDGRTLFVVGDPMQSIYQFREAEVGLFLRVRKEGLGPVKLEALRLTRNFRSRPALVDFSNTLFAQVFPHEDDMRLGAIRHSPSLAARKPAADSGVTLEAIPDGPADAESIATVRRVLEIRRRDATGRLAVLVPARRHAIPIALKLAQAGIAVRGIDLVPLKDVPAVRDFVALALAIDHAGHRIAWLTVLRAPWCGARLRSLQVLSGRKDAQLLPEALADDSRLGQLDPAERSRIVRVRDIVTEAVAARASLAPHELLEAAWLRLGGQDLYDEAGLESVREVLMAIEEAVAAREWSDAFSLESALDSLYASPDPAASGAGAVDIMTVHAAKGLEFEHVVLPGFAAKPGGEKSSLLRWLDLPRPATGSDLLMAPVVAEEDRDDDLLGRYIGALTAERRSHERRRLLYVAMTRARESLHLIAAIPRDRQGALVPAKRSLLEAGWAALAPQFVEIDAAGPGDAAPAQARIQRLPSGWQLPAAATATPGVKVAAFASAGTPEFSWVGEVARHIGTVTHRALQAWSASGMPPDGRALEAARESLQRQLARRGVAPDDLGDAADTVLAALGRVQADERGRWLFDATHREVASEFALSGQEGGRIVHAVIDRMFVDAAGTRWIVDYKTSRHGGGAIGDFLDAEMERYRPQLERYARLAASLGPEPVQVALYFPLLGAFRILADAPVDQ